MYLIFNDCIARNAAKRRVLFGKTLMYFKSNYYALFSDGGGSNGNKLSS